MAIEQFQTAPWKSTHEAYRKSSLAVAPAPEYASSEVLLSSLLRTIGFELPERSVPQAGREFEKSLSKQRDRKKKPDNATLEADIALTLFHGILETPVRPNQSARRTLQVAPIVPGIATISGAARNSGNSWHAGGIVQRLVWLGSSDDAAALHLWRKLFDALTVSDRDDVFARWLQLEVAAWANDEPKWTFRIPAPDDARILSPADRSSIQYPAKRFVEDLAAIIASKPYLTRRQWISLLESVVRIAAASHVTWLCEVHGRIWGLVSGVLSHAAVPAVAEARAAVFPTRLSYFPYGDRAMSGVDDLISQYLQARIGLNATLWFLEEAGAPFVGDMSSSQGVASLCQHIRDNLSGDQPSQLQSIVGEILEREARTLLCKKGVGANMHEFIQYSLGQRQSALPILRGYDQGYFLRKRGEHSSNPWVVALGPVSILALVHCTLMGAGGPRSIHRLSDHLATYGIAIEPQKIGASDLGQQLRMLGLILDSPDAESGMLLLPPFKMLGTELI
ncbi:MAG: hypothetical protein ABL879_01425 [Devosia sp.]